MYNNSQWESDLLLKPNEDGKTWTLRQELIYETDIGYKITVPAGFVTDLASIPRPLWVLWPPFGKYTRAAVIHDWLYDMHRKGGKHYSRCYADAILVPGGTKPPHLLLQQFLGREPRIDAFIKDIGL